MIIYLDVYFLKNFIFNFLLLCLTGTAIRKKIRWGHCVIASTVGAIYAVVVVYFENLFHWEILKIGVGVLMLLICFGKKEMRLFISSFFVLSYFIAGIIASFSFVNGKIMMAFLAIVTAGAFLKFQQKRSRQNDYEIKIKLLEKEVVLEAKLDTGNELRDSIFGTPVIVVEETIVKEIWGEELVKILNNERLAIPKVYQHRIKLISFHTVASEEVRVGIKLDGVTIEKGSKRLEGKAVMILTNAKMKDYQALIGNHLLEECFVYTKNEDSKVKDF